MSIKDINASNALETNDLHKSACTVSTAASTHFSLDPRDSGTSNTKIGTAMLDAETIIAAVRRMSDAERGKLLTALLGLADGHG